MESCKPYLGKSPLVFLKVFGNISVVEIFKNVYAWLLRRVAWSRI